MVRIESYIDAVIEDLKYTLSVLTDFGAEEERINRIQGFLDIFSSRNVTDIINNVSSSKSFTISSIFFSFLAALNFWPIAIPAWTVPPIRFTHGSSVCAEIVKEQGSNILTQSVKIIMRFIIEISS